jgi:hypothetical protein
MKREKNIRGSITETLFVITLMVSFFAILPSVARADILNFQISAGEYNITVDQQGFNRINMLTPDYGTMKSPGDPALPEKMLEFIVPEDIIWSSSKLSIEIQDSKILPGYNIGPNPPVKPVISMTNLTYDPEFEDWGIGKSILNGKNMYVYGRDANFPDQSVELLPYTERKEPIEIPSIELIKKAESSMGTFTIGTFAEMKFLRLAYRPFLYNPVNKNLTLINKANITITYDRNLITSPQIQSTGNTYDYVIITTNDIVSKSAKLGNFVHLKELMGHNVKVVTESDYDGLTGQAPNGRAEKIRQWLIDNYQSIGINYVLLIGNPDPDLGDIPMKKCWPGYAGRNYRDSPTDYFYADLTGNWDLDGDQDFCDGIDVNNPKSPDPSINENDYSARWTGKVMLDFNENYIFSTFSTNGVRLYIDGSLVIDDWTEHSPTYDSSAPQLMTTGKHDITLEFRKTTNGHGIIQLYNEASDVNNNIIPQDHLYDASDNVGGLTATYYSNPDLTGTSVTSKDNVVNHIWGAGDQGSGGPDTGAEVFVGRIPVYDNNFTQLDTILQKIIEYETDPKDISWRNKILLPMKPLWSDTPGFHIGEGIRNDFATAAGFTSFRIYEQDYNPPTPEVWPVNETNVVNEWKKGYGMITWTTHGWPEGAVDIFDSGLTFQLDDSKPSFTFQASCLNAYPENSNNLGYALLKHGAIATVAATRVSWDWHAGYPPGTWTFDPHDGMNHNLAYFYTKKVIDVGTPKSAGVALYLTKGDIPSVGMNEMDYNLYGDPETYLLKTFPINISSISGMKFNDSNGNGIKDIGESGLGSWTITLTDTNGKVSTQTTDPSGNYNFSGLVAGTYIIGEVLQPGWKQTIPLGGTYTLTLSVGEHIKDKDFGNFKLGEVPLAVNINIKGIPVIGHATDKILNVEYTNFNSGDPYNISIKAPNGTRVYYNSGTLTGTNQEIISIKWTPRSKGNHTIEAWGRGMINSTPVFIYDSEVVAPVPELETIVLVTAGILGLIGIRRRY